jgi:hypothetical protein
MIGDDPMGDEKTREDMILAAKRLRAFYHSLVLGDEILDRAVKADLSEPRDTERVTHKSEEEKAGS